jgi:hypothetical protein
MLAEVYIRSGQTEAALDAIVEGLAAASKTDERRYEAESHRIRGELLLRQAAQQGNTQSGALALSTEAETCFHHAIAIARLQHAKSLELRAVMSLSRLWQAQDKGAGTRQRLAEIYHWFTEGFTTVDLQEAKALLRGLP